MPHQHFLSLFLLLLSPALFHCGAGTTVSEVTTQLRLALHLQPWQRLLSCFFLSLSLSPLTKLVITVLDSLLHTDPTWNMTIHLALIPSSLFLLFQLDQWMLLTPGSVPSLLAISPSLHLTPLHRHAAKCQDEEYLRALSPCNELLSLLTLDRYPLELTSANHLFLFCLICFSLWSTPQCNLTLKPHLLN